MTDIFREVEEDLRRERLGRIWQRYGFFIIGLAALIVVGVAGWRAFESWQASRAAASGDRFVQAQALAQEGRHGEAIEALRALAQEGSGSYPVLARFRAAAVRAEAGEKAAAAAEFDALAADRSVPQALQGLARVRAANVLVDTAPREEIAARVESLAIPGDPWRHSARELMGLAAWKAGDLQAAERWFGEAASDPEVPQGVRSRSDLFLTLIAGTVRPAASAQEAARDGGTN